MNKMYLIIIGIGLFCVLPYLFSVGVISMKLKSSSFIDREKLSAKFSCDGVGENPALEWDGAPDATKSFVLIVEDPDAPSRRSPAPKPWVHWVVFNIPYNVTKIAEGAGVSGLENANQGLNSAEKVGFQGACPPRGSGEHRYYFRLYALDDRLPLSDGASREQIEEAMKGHVLAQAEIMGTYERQ